MGEVKSAFEKAMEKIKEIEVPPDEKEELKERERLRSALAAYYKGDLGKDQLWEKLKGIRSSLLSEAQSTMVDSIRLGGSPEEFRQRKDGILAMEALEKRKNMAAIENALKTVEKLQREYGETKERVFEEIRAAVEGNPQMRLRQVRTADGRTALQPMSIDEAIQTRIGEFLEEHEKRYEAIFNQAIMRLKKELK